MAGASLASSWSKIWKAGLVIEAEIARTIGIFFTGITTSPAAAGIPHASIIYAVGISFAFVAGLTTTACILNTPEVDTIMIIVATIAWLAASVRWPFKAFLVQANLEVAAVRIVSAGRAAVTIL